MSDDAEAIKQLKARYFRMMDTKGWDGLAAVFADDAEIDVSGEGGGVARGAAEFVSFLRARIEDAITVHHGHTPEIELTSPKRRQESGLSKTSSGGLRVDCSPTCTASATTTRPTRRPTPAGGSSP
jgi:SnoaL-like domain